MFLSFKKKSSLLVADSLVGHRVYTESDSAAFFSCPSHMCLTEKIHSYFNQYYCLHSLRNHDLKHIFLRFTHVAERLQCRHTNRALTAVAFLLNMMLTLHFLCRHVVRHQSKALTKTECSL